MSGQTYVLSWNDASGLAPDGYYEVERSLTESFATILDSQQTAATSASFLPAAPGVYFHRVRPVNPCNLSQPGPNSATKTVTVASAPPNVIFTVQPRAVITTLGQNIEDVQSRFVIENIGTETAQVVVGRQEINSPPFFRVVDPLGGDSVNLTLEPRKPKAMEIHFSGPPNDQPATYQGIILLSSPGRALAVTPYAFVNLGVGGGPTARPRFLISGSDTEYVFFPGFAGDDTLRPPISVEVHNAGATPMELGAEIGPEVWLVPEPGWNSTAIPPGASRTLRLFTRRNRAPHGSALPRYTYLVVRSKNGETARLLVQDNNAVQTGAGRSSLLEPGSRSYVVPGVISTSADGASGVSRVRLSNAGSEPVQTELFFTPAGADGFDGPSVRRATVVVPPNDVVTLTDPLVQVFGLIPPAQGQIEVRAAPERIGSLTVSASVITPVTTGGVHTYQLATLQLGEGARIGSGHVILGLDTSGSTRTSLTLAETSGTQATRVRITVFDAQGGQRGQTSETIARYGQKTIDLGSLISGASLEGGRVELIVESGGGSVAGVVTLLGATQNSGATLVSQPAAGSVLGKSGRIGPSQGSQLATAVVPVVVNGALPGSRPGPPATFRTSMGFTTAASPSTAVVVYRPSDPTAPLVERTVQLAPRVSVHFRNVLEQLFGVPAGASVQGSIFVQAAAGAQIYAHLLPSGAAGASGTMAGSLPIFGTLSEVLTSLAQRRPLYLDGLEQSTDPERGSRWSLLINETAGSGGNVTVRLYEAGNRSLPVAEKTMAIRGYEQIRLDTVFASLGLDTDERRKDRTNVLCVVTAAGGNAVISAVGAATDNATGDTKHYVFSPSGGVPATGVIRVSVVTPVAPPPPPSTTRRRAVRRP